MSYASWVRFHRRQDDPLEVGARQYLGIPEPGKPPETEWPHDKFHRYCPQHNERLNWLLCPKGHELGSADAWIVKDEETGEVIDVCRDNDGTGQWKGFAPRH